MYKQEFEDHTADGKAAAVFTSTYDLLKRVVHRASYESTARKLAKEFKLPGFWRVKGSK